MQERLVIRNTIDKPSTNKDKFGIEIYIFGLKPFDKHLQINTWTGFISVDENKQNRQEQVKLRKKNGVGVSAF